MNQAETTKQTDQTPRLPTPLQIWSTLQWYLDQMVHQFLQRDCLSAAAALTYTTLFAVVPLMTVTYAFFSILPQYAAVGEQLQDFVFNNFVPGRSEIVQEKLNEFSNRASQLTAVGFLFLFVTSFTMLLTIEQSFNSIWRVTEPRRGLQRFLVYWGVLSLGPTSVVVGMLSSLYLLSMPMVTDLDTLGIRELFLGYLPVILNVALFTVLYYAVPNCYVSFRHALSGGVFSTLLFQGGFIVFAQTSRWFSYDAIYGTFAAVPVFLLWLYLVWVIVLCGAIFVRCLAMARDEDSGGDPLLVKAARILQLLHATHQSGGSVSPQQMQSTIHMTESEQDRVIGVLQELKLLRQTDDGYWILGRSLKHVTLWDLYRKMPEGLELERLKAVKDLPGVVAPLISIAQFGSNEMSVSLDQVFTS